MYIKYYNEYGDLRYEQLQHLVIRSTSLMDEDNHEVPAFEYMNVPDTYIKLLDQLTEYYMEGIEYYLSGFETYHKPHTKKQATISYPSQYVNETPEDFTITIGFCKNSPVKQGQACLETKEHELFIELLDKAISSGSQLFDITAINFD